MEIYNSAFENQTPDLELIGQHSPVFECDLFHKSIKEFYREQQGSSSFYDLLGVSSSGLQGECGSLNTAPTFAERCDWPR